MVAAALSVDDLLEVWDRAADAGPVERALVLRSAAEPGRPLAEIAAEPIGARDRVLLEVLGATFGRDVACVVDCPSCGTTGELDVDLAALTSVGDADRPSRPAEPLDDERTWRLEAEGWTVAFRLPTTADLTALDRPADVVDATTQLRERVLVKADPPDRTTDASVPAAVWDHVEAAMAALDPLAELRLDARCHACGSEIDALLDPAAFLWRRLDVEVRALLADVDLLARSYGWSERDILALSPARRRHYLERLET